MAHKVKAFHWSKGHLRVQERHFDSLESAQAFINSDELEIFEAKIYEDDDLLHHVSATVADTYA